MGSRVKKYRMKPIPSAFSEKGNDTYDVAYGNH